MSNGSRRELKLSNYMAAHKAKGPIANVKILRSYLGGDSSKGKSLRERGRKLEKIIETWQTTVHEPAHF